MTSPKHHGGPFKKKFKEYEQPWHVQKFEPVRIWICDLEEDIRKYLDTQADQNKHLSQIAAILDQVSDDVFGVNGTPDDRKVMTRIPAKLFRDFEPAGGLCYILITALKYKLGKKGFNFEDTLLKGDRQSVREHIPLFLEIEKVLLNASLLKRPKVVFSNDISKEERAELKDIVLAHNGSVVNAREQATHEIIPEVLDDEPEQDYCRTLEMQDKMAKVHWWYYPDSYDEWKNRKEIQGELPEPPAIPALYVVTARFLRDLEKFNEWMNEEDYTNTEEDGEDADDDGAAAAGEAVGEKRKRESVEPRAKTENDGDLPAHPAKAAAQTQQQDAKLQGVYRPPSTSLSRLQTGSVRAQFSLNDFSPARPYSVGSGKPRTEREPTGDPVLVPSYAAWFDFGAVHAIEKRDLPEWFRGVCASKTPRTYVESRNLIVRLYRESPRRYLTATECRRHIAGDVCSIYKLHAFLEHWGLVNYNIAVHDRPVTIGPMTTAGHPVLLAMPDGTLVPREATVPGLHGRRAEPPPRALAIPAPRLGARPNLFAAPEDDAAAAAGPVRCVVSGEDCSADRYHCIARPELVISPAIYAAPSESWPAALRGYAKSDFARVVRSGAARRPDGGSSEPLGVGDWTEAETLRLLEALERHGEGDWSAVAEHVGTKTKEQCVLQFIRLPIEDRFLDDGEGASAVAGREGAMAVEPTGDSTEAGSGGQRRDDVARGEVMAQVARLCEDLPPELAARATEAALQVIVRAESQHAGSSSMPAVRPSSGGEGAARPSKAGDGDAAGTAGGDETMTDGPEASGDAMDTTGGAPPAAPSAAGGDGGQAVGTPAAGETGAGGGGGGAQAEAELRARRATALAAVSLRAKAKAVEEEQEVQRLLGEVVARQMHKIELKLKQFQQLEQLLLYEIRGGNR